MAIALRSSHFGPAQNSSVVRFSMRRVGILLYYTVTVLYFQWSQEPGDSLQTDNYGQCAGFPLQYRGTGTRR